MICVPYRENQEKKSLAKMMVATVEGAIMAAKAAQSKEPYLEIIKQMFLFVKKTL